MFTTRVSERLASNLSHAVQNHDDIRTVEQALPAYLLMTDALIEGDPQNQNLLVTGATLYSSYASLFGTDEEEVKRLTDRALHYGVRAVCCSQKASCDILNMAFGDFLTLTDGLKQKDVPAFYALASSWASWIQARKEDWNALADLARVESLMKRIVEIDESYQEGSGHVYLGIMATLLPASMGGRPDEGKRHFERAIEISSGRNLMYKVAYARYYARLVFDRELHDRLLKDVLAGDPNVPGFVLVNRFAQKQAQELLNDADDYF